MGAWCARAGRVMSQEMLPVIPGGGCWTRDHERAGHPLLGIPKDSRKKLRAHESGCMKHEGKRGRSPEPWLAVVPGAPDWSSVQTALCPGKVTTYARSLDSTLEDVGS